MNGRPLLVLSLVACALVLGQGLTCPVRAQEPSRTTGPDTTSQADLDVAEVYLITRRAEYLQEQGAYDEAEKIFKSLVARREGALGPDDPLVGQSLRNLASFYQAKGDYARAEPLYQRVVSIVEKAFGRDGQQDAESLRDLASLYLVEGDYARAEPVYQRVLADFEKAFGPDDERVATSLGNLATLYSHKGDHESSERLNRRALAIAEKAFGPNDAAVAEVLNNLVADYLLQADYTRARPLCERALAILEKALGPDHTFVAGALMNLARVQFETKDYAHAEPLYERSLAILEKALGPDNPPVAGALVNVAMLYQAKGDYTRANALFQRALRIDEKALGPDHPQLAALLTNLARLSWAQGNPPGAVAFLSRGLDVLERHVTRVLAVGSEEQRRLFLATFRSGVDFAVSLHAQAAPQDPAARAAALLEVLRHKGRIVDGMADSFATFRSHMVPEDAALLEKWRSVETDLAHRTLTPSPERMTVEDHRKELDSLGAQANELQAEIAARSAEFRVTAAPVTIDAIQRAIPAGAALVEIVAYSPHDPRGNTDVEQWVAPPRYAAYALRPSGEIAYADLGEARPTDDLVARLRAALAVRASDPGPPARALDERIGRPLRAIIGDAVHVLLAPDGALNLIPFGALIDERGEFLLGRYAFTYLTTGRDLLRLGSRDAAPTTPPLIVASPDFGELSAAASPNRGVDLRSARFPALPGTAQEGHAIAALLPGAVVLEGTAATKSAVTGAGSPTVLHIATHGFFLEDVPAPPIASGRGLTFSPAQDAQPIPIDNPLLRSGLAFAGANLHRTDDNGVMTALEASALDLWGTKLVVLSACETGIGTVKNGEGVYGLRRALVLAGAKSQVISLWKVDDAATRDLMVAYYKALQSGGGRTDALRRAQLAMLHSKDRAHPYFWASFIPSGDWRSLADKEVPMQVANARAPDILRVKPGACGCESVGRTGSDRAAVWASAAGLVVAAGGIARRRSRSAKQVPALIEPSAATPTAAAWWLPALAILLLLPSCDERKAAYEHHLPALTAKATAVQAIARSTPQPVTTDAMSCDSRIELKDKGERTAWVLYREQLQDPNWTSTDERPCFGCADMTGEYERLIGWVHDREDYLQTPPAEALALVQRYGDLRYVLELVVLAYRRGGSLGGTTFIGGTFDADVHAFDLRTQRECGAFHFAATSTPEFTSSRPAQRAVDVDLDHNVITAFNRALLKLAPDSGPLRE